MVKHYSSIQVTDDTLLWLRVLKEKYGCNSYEEVILKSLDRTSNG